ncbi:unnamed protein product [Brugia timori]|uniref:Secreted protein n=1 Tax=Brugia timori TaxID=42155 RepID=A0A0R3QKH6_9BILA|nr:unnamed protein product [Brugia timori]
MNFSSFTHLLAFTKASLSCIKCASIYFELHKIQILYPSHSGKCEHKYKSLALLRQTEVSVKFVLELRRFKGETRKLRLDNYTFQIRQFVVQKKHNRQNTKRVELKFAIYSMKAVVDRVLLKVELF